MLPSRIKRNGQGLLENQLRIEMRIKRFFGTLECFFGNKWFPLLLVPIAAGFLLLYSFSTSPLHLENEGCDCVIFKTMGLAILQGKVPYVDLFDHKGPFLYFINALGQWMIPGRNGILVLQLISLSITLVFLFKMARLFVNNVLSFVWLMVSLCIMGAFYNEGNLTEEWNLPYVVIPLFLSLKYITVNPEEQHPSKYSVVYGLCFGLAFFIRPNDAVAQVGGVMTGLTLWMIYRKQYRNAIQNAALFMAGFLIVALPFVAWFAAHGALKELYYGLIQFNSLYSGGVSRMIWTVAGKPKIKFFMFFVALAILVFNTKHRRVLYVLVPVLAFIAIMTGERLIPHYFIVTIPFFMLFFVFLCLQQNKSLVVCSIAVLLASQIDTLRTARKMVVSTTKQAVQVIKNGQEEPAFYKESDRLLAMIPEESRNHIWNYNLDFRLSMLWHQGLVQSNKVPLYSMYYIDNKLKVEDDLKQHEPDYILLLPSNTIDSLDMDFINRCYTLVGTTDTVVCDVYLYKKK